MTYEPVPGVTRAVESLTLIDRCTTVEGTLTSSRDIRIEGELRGTLRCEGSIQIAEGARVDATVEAGGITVAGTLRGSIDCRGKLHILKTGFVSGTITTRTLVIEEGGRCEGDLSMPTGEPAHARLALGRFTATTHGPSEEQNPVESEFVDP